MKNSRTCGFRILAVLFTAGICFPAYAQTVTGDIHATITLEAACEVNEDAETTDVDFGTLDFGTNSTLFSSADAQVSGNGAGSISVQCTPGSDATLTVDNGLNDASAIVGGSRALVNGALVVPYDIYSDSSFSTVLNNGSSIPITGDGTVQDVEIYGRAVGTAGLTAGTYTDTISLTLTF
ncbi:spore coat U domain-containing protein [Sphingopyxis granuli]|uniref:Csu type fimbrial protein n=1 Tax=Sphingopyxis granuli TaxID=267128 RepID=UPI001F5383A9|nr:spore coat U domain-containing protein [Sphingopyxis granuli]UNK79786.1 spore coat U domain-containing protein [Sphingopyxis granuli]